MLDVQRYENRRQRRKRRRAARRRQERMAAKLAGRGSRAKVENADCSDASNSSSDDESSVVRQVGLVGQSTGGVLPPRKAVLATELRTFEQMVERENAMKRLERAMRLQGLTLERAHFEHCTVQEIRRVTARYNKYNQASVIRRPPPTHSSSWSVFSIDLGIDTVVLHMVFCCLCVTWVGSFFYEQQVQRERRAFDLWDSLDNMVENAAAERLQRSIRRYCKRKADQLARAKAQAERDEQQLAALRARQVG